MNGPQRAQVALVPDATGDDQRRAVAEVGREARQRDLAGEQLALLAHVLDRVVGEALERIADLAPARLGFRAHALAVEHLAACEQLALAQHLRTVTRRSHRAKTTGSPSETRVEQRVVGQVDEQDPRLDEQLRAEVGVGAAGGRAAVEHRGGARGDQLLRGDAIDIEMVDQRDVAAHEMPDEQLRAPARAHRAGDARRDRQIAGVDAIAGPADCVAATAARVTPGRAKRLQPACGPLRLPCAGPSRACARRCRRCRRRASARAR